MADKEKIIYEIDIETDGATKGLNEIDKASTNAKDSLDKTQSSFKQFGDSVKNLDFKGAIAGLGGMTKAALAFIATPLGAAIAAISAAIAAMTTYFKGSEEGQKRLNQIMTIGSAIMGKFATAVSEVGKFLVEGFIKGFQAVSNVLSKFVPGFDELTKKVEAFLQLDTATNISNLEEQIILLNRQLIVQRDVLKAEIEAAKLRAESTKDEKVRSAAYTEVEGKVRKLFELEKQLAQAELQAAEQRASLAPNDIEANDKLAEQKARLAALDREESAMLKENATKQLALSEQKTAANEKFLAELEMIRQAQEDYLNGLLVINEQELANIDFRTELQKQDQELAEEDIQFNADVEEEITLKVDEETQIRMNAALKAHNYKKSLIASGLTAAQAEAKIYKDLEAQKVAATSDALGASLGLFKQNTAAYKTIATGKAIIDTYQAANLALSTYPPPFGAIMAALSVALGLINVAKITSVAAAGGADFVTKGPTMLIVGDNPGGREHVKVTPMSGRGTTRVWNGGVAAAGGANFIAGGSAIASAQTSPIDAQFMLSDTIKNLPPSQLVYTEFNEFQQKISFKESLTSQ